MTPGAPEPRRRRAAWVCRLIGHRHRDPLRGYVIHLFIPSAEGRLGYSDPRGILIGTCNCGHEWWSRA